MLTTLYLVFSEVMNLKIPYYQHFLLIGIIVWNYFSSSTTNSLDSFKNNRDLFQQYKIPRYLPIISACLINLIEFFVSVGVLIVFLFIFDVPITFLSLLNLIYFFLLIILSFGVSLIISSIYLIFKDIKHIWNFSLLIGFWISPIVYSEMKIPSNLRRFYMINPIARIISHIRNVTLYNYIAPTQTLITIIICTLILFFGFWLFKIYSTNLGEKL